MSYMEKVRAWERAREPEEPETVKDSVVTQISNYEKYRQQIRRRGYAAVRSGTLGEVIYLCKDERAADRCPAGAAVYTESDLAELVKDAPDRQQLKIINESKKLFHGSRIIGKEV